MVAKIEQVGGNDLEVVVGRMGEGAAAIAIAQSEDALDIGREPVVDLDVAALVACNAGDVESQVVRIGAPTDRQQHVAADHRAWLLLAMQADPDAIARRREVDALGIEPDRDPLALQDVPDGIGDFRVLA